MPAPVGAATFEFAMAGYCDFVVSFITGDDDTVNPDTNVMAFFRLI
jgi:hypothetical protein